jgi:hypothetical protein
MALDEDGAFKDFVYRGMDSLLKLTSKAADSIRVASDNAIERLDAAQLDRKLSTLYSQLGMLSYDRLSVTGSVKAGDEEINQITVAIDSIIAELARRKSGECSSKKSGDEK